MYIFNKIKDAFLMDNINNINLYFSKISNVKAFIVVLYSSCYTPFYTNVKKSSFKQLFIFFFVFYEKKIEAVNYTEY